MSALLLLLATSGAQAQTIDAVYSYSGVSAGFRIGVSAQRVHHELDPQSGHFTNEEGWAGDYTLSGNDIELFFVDEYTATAGYAAIWEGTTGANGLVCPSNNQGGGTIRNVAGTPEWKHTECPIGTPSTNVQISAADPSRHRLTVAPQVGGPRNSGLLSHTPYAIVYGLRGQAGTTVLSDCPDLELDLAGGGELARARTNWAAAPNQGSIRLEVPAALVNVDVDLVIVDLAACQASPEVGLQL